jgi:hypothetical protein
LVAKLKVWSCRPAKDVMDFVLSTDAAIGDGSGRAKLTLQCNDLLVRMHDR